MQDSHKERIDVLLVSKNLASSRERAKRMIMAGLVFAGGQRVDKPGTLIDPDDQIEVRGEDHPYVSRGGLKLEKALRKFDIPVKGLTFMDIGASTGGFTDCLLKNGASKVYAIDVGYGQLAWELRQDPRVMVMERTNVRNITKADIKDAIQGAVIDVSFISLRLVLPVAYDILEWDSHIVALIKPQFEVGRGKVGKKGVVRDKSLHLEAVLSILDFCPKIGLCIRNLDYSPITGPQGNIEFLAHLYKGSNQENMDISKLAAQAVDEAHDFFDNKDR
ncbi:MAG TPA: TlyA family RNA methyltransferase [Candidatus Atribacteria bacterium]|nr:TlyA family RNA methyltransferase [Candidatus Atribacteria bacterium]